MKYVAMFLILLSISGCISSGSGINAAMSVPEMLIDGEMDSRGVLGAAAVKRKPTIPVDMDDYNIPTKPSVYEENI